MSYERNLLLAADVGTTNIKAGVVDEKGRVLSYAEEKIWLRSPEKGAAEHDPIELYSIFKRVCRKAVSGHKKDVLIIALSSYQCGFMPVDENISPLCGMLTLLDTRCEKIAGEIKDKYNCKKIYSRTGCPPFSIYPLPKILWLRKYKPEIFKKTRYFLGSKDYLIYRLTGKICTDPSIASATQLFNINSLKWDGYSLSIAGISGKKLPTVVAGDKILCNISKKAAGELGLKRDTAVLPGVYDGGSVAIGLGGISGRFGVINLGTTAMLRTACPKPLLDGAGLMRFQTYYLCNKKWLTGGAINNAGVVLQWLKGILYRKTKRGNSLNRMIAEAGISSPGSDGLLFLPFLTGERDPRMGSSARGMISGLKIHHDHRSLVRSALEGVAYSLRYLKEALKENGVSINEARIGGGGAGSGPWVRIISDVLGVTVRTVRSGYTPLLGCAVLGYTALGRYKNLKEASDAIVRLDKPVIPIPKNIKIYDKQYKLFQFLVEKLSRT